MKWPWRHTEFDDLSTADQLRAALEESFDRPVVLFKHSRVCGVSYVAQREMARLGRDVPTRVYRLVVQTAREVSRAVEETLGVRHESPQAIVVFRGRTVFSTSHHNIKTQIVRQAVEGSRADEI